MKNLDFFFYFWLLIFNSFLQAKFVQGFSDLGRFIINSTVGVFGFMDPATGAGLPVHREDFGQTLARWGVPSGPFLVIPIIGPSTLRDGTGTLVDFFWLNPVWDIKNHRIRAWTLAIWFVQARASLLVASDQIDEAFDPYLFLREAFLQQREYLIHDGNPPVDDEFFDDFEDFEDEEF